MGERILRGGGSLTVGRRQRKKRDHSRHRRAERIVMLKEALLVHGERK